MALGYRRFESWEGSSASGDFVTYSRQPIITKTRSAYERYSSIFSSPQHEVRMGKAAVTRTILSERPTEVGGYL